jgi:hypothetical protein
LHRWFRPGLGMFDIRLILGLDSRSFIRWATAVTADQCPGTNARDHSVPNTQVPVFVLDATGGSGYTMRKSRLKEKH